MQKTTDIDLIQKLDFLWIELTEKCNLTCTHCYADSSPKHKLNLSMTIDTWKKTILDAFLMGCKKIQFAGGEPTIHPDLEELIKFSSDLGFEFIEIHTNALSISDKLFQTIIDRRVAIGVSFYSHIAAIHDKITTLQGSFDRTINNIRKLIKSNVNLRISIVKMKENENCIAETIQFLKAEGITSELRVDTIRNVGRGKNEFEITSNGFEHLCGNCWKGTLVVNSKGEIYPCPLSRQHTIAKIENGLTNAATSNKLYEFREKLMHYVGDKNLNPQCLINCPPGNCSPANSCSPASWPTPPTPCSPPPSCRPSDWD